MIRTLILLLFAAACGGCASFTNPVADGVPVNRLPPEVLGRPKAELRSIPLTLLRQKAPEKYQLDAGDVLAIVANEVIAPGEQPPPIQQPDQPGHAPVTGYPVPVMGDGTISIPLLKPISVRGKTVQEVEQLLKDIITGKTGGPELVKPNAARVSVQLLRRRTYQVMVVRADTPGGGGSVGPAMAGGGVGNPFANPYGGGVYAGAAGTTGGSISGKRGTGYTIGMPAYENDLLRALNSTGGLPGLDAANEVIIVRGGKSYCDAADPVPHTIRIPLRVYPEQPITIREEDIILHDGDVVTIPARDADVFYTAGLTRSSVFPLPRDSDLDVLQALAMTGVSLLNGSTGATALNGSAVGGAGSGGSGVGFPNASLCVVLRQLPDKQQVAIRVDVNKAFRDPRERILIQPGDYLIYQERPSEGLTRYLTQTIRFTAFTRILKTPDATINGGAVFP